MKKSVAFAIAMTVLSVSVTALADAAATDTGQTTATTRVTGASDYSTVLITDSGNNIVYVNQADSSFSASADFLLKANPNYGKYNVKLGGENVEAQDIYFYVGVDAPEDDDVTMKRLQNEETSDGGTTYKIGYYTDVEADYAETYNSLKVGFDGNPAYGGFDLGEHWDDTHYSGSGSLYLIFQLNDVPASWKDSLTVFLSHDQVSKN